MSDSTSFTVPKDPEIYRALAKYLLGEADTIAEPACKHCGCMEEQDAEAGPSLRVVATKEEADEVVKTDVAPPPPPAAETAEKTEAETAFAETATDVAPPPPPAAEPAPGPAVELAGEPAIPWDSRTHGSGKKKLAKAPHGWKLKRKPGTMAQEEWDAFVSQVEAELVAAMAASPASPVIPAAEVGSTNVPPAAPAPPAGTAAPAPPAGSTAAPAASGEITQPFPLFMRRVSAAGLAQEVVLAAVNKAGLASIPILATRPDLIPAVEAELFPEA